MLLTPSSFLVLALASTTSLAQDGGVGNRTVYITSKVNSKFAIEPKAPVRASTTIVVQTLSSSASSDAAWVLSPGDTKIQLAGTGLCIDAGAESAWRDMAPVYLRNCTAASADDPAQLWDVMADGRIALKASSPQECLDLQYARAMPNNPVGLYSCAGLGGIGAADSGINWPLANVTTTA